MTPDSNSEKTPTSCPVGGCGTTKGMCPGIALGISYLLCAGIIKLSGIDWLGYLVGIAVGILLILGYYPTGGRWFRNKKPIN